MEQNKYGRMGSTQSPLLGTPITIKRLKKRGYISMSEYFNSISPNYNNSLFRVMRNCPVPARLVSRARPVSRVLGGGAKEHHLHTAFFISY